MGHYYADLMCDTCSEIRCTCPPKPDHSDKHFTVLHDYRVMTKAEASKAGMTPLTRAFAPSFKLREDAEEAAKDNLEQDLARAKSRLAYLKAVKAAKPWKVKK